MRLTPSQQTAWRSVLFSRSGSSARLSVSGSRVDDIVIDPPRLDPQPQPLHKAARAQGTACT